MVPEVHPPSPAPPVADAAAVPDIANRVGQDSVRADLQRVLTPPDQPVPGGPGSSADVSDGLVSVSGVEGTEGKSGRFLDLREESFELFVEACGGHVAISELGPPPRPGSGLLGTDPGWVREHDQRLENETVRAGQPSSARPEGRSEEMPSRWVQGKAGSVRAEVVAANQREG